MNKSLLIIPIIYILLFSFSCTEKPSIDEDELINHAKLKIEKTLQTLSDSTKQPRHIPEGEKHWKTNGITSWTSGFFPGILWYMYEYTKDDYWKEQAHRFTMPLEPIKELSWKTHDFGLMVFNSFGNGYLNTQNDLYKQILLQTADSLATLYNPTIGTLLSWPWRVKKSNWPHNTIIDNMMNLELLFWASKNGGRKELYDIAVAHAKNTMKNQFRDDHTVYHVVVYDTVSGLPINKVTDQGYSDSSTWARGQAWAIYGYAMTYRETQEKEFLDMAIKATEAYLKRLPDDFVPYWDFDAPEIPNEPKDASAAAIATAGILELIPYLEKKDQKHYWQIAISTLKSLSSDTYLSKEQNDAILLHSTGSRPHHSEIDVPIIYADYYFIEALLKVKKLKSKYSTLLG